MALQSVGKCPRCQSPMSAYVEQVFDLAQDASAKEKLLSGQANLAVCQSCGFSSAIGVPMIYHDPEKELLLTYFPSEMGIPLEEQEKTLGSMITQIVNRLPMESRKGYLLRPQSMLKFETLIEKVLEADGITKEMLQAQEQKMNLLQRLLTCDVESIPEIVKQESALLDQAFFALFSNVQANIVQSQDEAMIARLKSLQAVLLSDTEYGQELKKRAASTNQALMDLQALGDGLNQDSLLDLVLRSPDDAYLQTLIGVARNGMDYGFFSKLTDRITAEADDAAKKRYEEIREQLLQMVQKIDAAVAEQEQLRKQVFDALMAAPNLEESITTYARAIDENFMQIVNAELNAARKSGDFMRSGKIQTLLDTIEKMSKIPDEIVFLEKLIEKDDPAEIAAEMEAQKEQVTDAFRATLDQLVEQLTPIPDQTALLGKLKVIQSVIAT